MKAITVKELRECLDTIEATNRAVFGKDFNIDDREIKFMPYDGLWLCERIDGNQSDCITIDIPTVGKWEYKQ